MKSSSILFLVFLLTVFVLNAIAQEDTLKDFNFSIGSKYKSRFTSYGIEMANESPAIGLNLSVSHASGFYSDASFVSPLESDLNANQTIIDIGYEKEVSSFFSFSIEFNQYFFSNDTLSLLSGFSNSIDLGADFSFDEFDIGLSFDQFLGESGASYFSFDVSRFISLKPFYVLPIVQMVFLSQEIENPNLLKGKKAKKKDPQITATDNVTLTGLANTIVTIASIYPVNKKISISLFPSLIISHQEDLSEDVLNFVWSIGLKYKF
jgi:hypothetical protein